MNKNITADDNTRVMPIKTFVGSGFGSAFGTSFAVTESGTLFLKALLYFDIKIVII